MESSGRCLTGPVGESTATPAGPGRDQWGGFLGRGNSQHRAPGVEESLARPERKRRLGWRAVPSRVGSRPTTAGGRGPRQTLTKGDPPCGCGG